MSLSSSQGLEIYSQAPLNSILICVFLKPSLSILFCQLFLNFYIFTLILAILSLSSIIGHWFSFQTWIWGLLKVPNPRPAIYPPLQEEWFPLFKIKKNYYYSFAKIGTLYFVYYCLYGLFCLVISFLLIHSSSIFLFSLSYSFVNI